MEASHVSFPSILQRKLVYSSDQLKILGCMGLHSGRQRRTGSDLVISVFKPGFMSIFRAGQGIPCPSLTLSSKLVHSSAP